MLNDLLLSPVVIFLIVLAVVALLAWLSKGLEARSNSVAPGKGEPYACGQNVPTGKIQPGYGDFFQFAFLFTLLEVVALVVGTITASAVWLSAVILLIVALAIFILFRRD